jgi:hypothetical protein
MRRPATAVRATAIGVSAAYSAALYLAGVTVGQDMRRGIAYLPAMAALLLIAWDLWAWRWPLVWRLTCRPRIDGLWEAILDPTDESHIPPGGNRGPIVAYAVIAQTYWSVAIRQYTAESSSSSRSFFWDNSDGMGVESLVFTYDNTPMMRHVQRSPRHLGTCRLSPGQRQPTIITGSYFTDRYTQGDMQLNLIERNRGYGSYGEAQLQAQQVKNAPQSGKHKWMKFFFRKKQV